MEISLTTPALLFPAISLLLLAYTNRFLAIATIIRSLHKLYVDNKRSVLEGQIKNLRRRLYLIRSMQFFGVGSLFTCVLTMIFIYAEYTTIGYTTFGVSLVLFLMSLFISLREIQLSTKALELELSDMEFEFKDRF